MKNMTICEFFRKLFKKREVVEPFKHTPNLEEWTDREREMLGYINTYRADHGLPLLLPDTTFYSISQERIDYIIEKDPRKSLSHEGVSIVFSKLQNEGAVALSENLAYGYYSIHTCFLRWIESESHEHNIRGNWKYTGIAIKPGINGVKYYCQMFGR